MDLAEDVGAGLRGAIIKNGVTRADKRDPGYGRRLLVFSKARLTEAFGPHIRYDRLGFSFEKDGDLVQVFLCTGYQWEIRETRSNLLLSDREVPELRFDGGVFSQPTQAVVARFPGESLFGVPLEGGPTSWEWGTPRSAFLDEAEKRRIGSTWHPLPIMAVGIRIPGPSPRFILVDAAGKATVMEGVDGRAGSASYRIVAEEGGDTFTAVFSPDNPEQAERFVPQRISALPGTHRPAFWASPYADGFSWLEAPRANGRRSLRKLNPHDLGQASDQKSIAPNSPFWNKSNGYWTWEGGQFIARRALWDELHVPSAGYLDQLAPLGGFGARVFCGGDDFASAHSFVNFNSKSFAIYRWTRCEFTQKRTGPEIPYDTGSAGWTSPSDLTVVTGSWSLEDDFPGSYPDFIHVALEGGNLVVLGIGRSRHGSSVLQRCTYRLPDGRKKCVPETRVELPSSARLIERWGEDWYAIFLPGTPSRLLFYHRRSGWHGELALPESAGVPDPHDIQIHWATHWPDFE